MTKRGFTLIEVIMYFALFSILIGGAIVSAFNLFESSARAQSRAMMQEEGDFLVGKINWVLSGAQAVTSPLAGASGSTLLVSKWDTSVGNPIQIALSGTDILISTSTNLTSYILNNSNVQISNLLFYHTLSSGVGADPEMVQFSFTISARTTNGMLISQYFPTSTVAIRR